MPHGVSSMSDSVPSQSPLFDNDDDDQEEDEYVVEAIRGWRYNSVKRQKEFNIKWKGYSETDNTWEPEDNLLCTHLLNQFRANLSPQDRLCFYHHDPDGLTGFQRHATYEECLEFDGPHDSDLDEDSGKVDRQPFYCLIKFEDSEYAEEVTLSEFFQHKPEEAFKFVEGRLVDESGIIGGQVTTKRKHKHKHDKQKRRRAEVTHDSEDDSGIPPRKTPGRKRVSKR